MFLQNPGGNSGNPIELLPRIPVIAFDQLSGDHLIWMFILSHLTALPACLFLMADKGQKIVSHPTQYTLLSRKPLLARLPGVYPLMYEMVYMHLFLCR